MIIPVQTENVRLTVNVSDVSSNQTKAHQYNIQQLYDERNRNRYELQLYLGSNTIPIYSSKYSFDVSSNGVASYIDFVFTRPNNSIALIRLFANGNATIYNYGIPGNWSAYISDEILNGVSEYLASDGLSVGTYTVGYSSERLCVEFYDENTASFLFQVVAVGDTTGNAEQVFCTKVPSKNFLAKSTPSLFTVTQDSENTNLYYIACKTSGYTTTLNVIKIIDTSNGSVALYLESA